MKDFEWQDCEGDTLEVSPCNSVAIGWCIYAYATESEDKAKSIDVNGVKVICAQEVGVAIPLLEAVKLRDYLTRAIAYCEKKINQENS
jgi:hypothetical protein